MESPSITVELFSKIKMSKSEFLNQMKKEVPGGVTKKELNSIETVIWTMKSFPFMLKIFKLKLVSSTLFFAPWLFPSFLLENTSNQIHTYPNMELKIFI